MLRLLVELAVQKFDKITEIYYLVFGVEKQRKEEESMDDMGRRVTAVLSIILCFVGWCIVGVGMAGGSINETIKWVAWLSMIIGFLAWSWAIRGIKEF